MKRRPSDHHHHHRTAHKKNRMSAPENATDLASLLECPVCFDYVLPPILQCQSGHLVCSSCRPKLSCCPTCRGPLGNIRNLAMEQVANTLKFTCKYSSSGCHLTLMCNEKLEHEEQCPFRPYSCPCPGASCKWQGPLEQVMPHLFSAHKSITNLTGEDIVFLATDINLPGKNFIKKICYATLFFEFRMRCFNKWLNENNFFFTCMPKNGCELK